MWETNRVRSRLYGWPSQFYASIPASKVPLGTGGAVVDWGGDFEALFGALYGHVFWDAPLRGALARFFGPLKKMHLFLVGVLRVSLAHWRIRCSHEWLTRRLLYF